MGFIELHEHDDLRLGLFVKLEGSWFSHPFPTNTFKIKSTTDLATIRNLKKVKIFYDPDRSDMDETTQGLEESRIDDVQEKDSDEPLQETVAEQDQDSIDQIEVEREQILERSLDYQDFREHLRNVEGSYQKVLGKNNEFLTQVDKGKAKGLNVAEEIVAGIQKTLENPNSAMSLIDVMGSNGIMWGLSEHALNVCMLSLLIGKHMGLSSEESLSVGIGGLLHDVGYRALPMKVKFLTAGMKIQPDQDILRDHPAAGCSLLNHLPGTNKQLLNIVAQHHERLDGSGYPKQLRKDEITKLAKILMVADKYDELCNAPDPESSLIPHDALSRLYRHVVSKGELSQYCEHAVQALVQAVGVYPPGALWNSLTGSLEL